MAQKHLRKCSASLTIGEMQIKTALRFHLRLVRTANIKTKQNKTKQTNKQNPQVTAEAAEYLVVEKEEYSSFAGGITRWYEHFGKKSGSSSQNWK